MKKPTRIFFILLLAIVMTSGCGLNLGGGQGSQDEGTARFAVTRISSDLLRAIGGSASRATGTASKTFLIADRVAFWLFDSNGDQIDYWEATPSLIAGPDAPAASDKALDAGQYSVYVQIYNLANDATTQWTAYGSQNFTVYANQYSEVHITCTPANAAYLPELTNSDLYSLPYPVTVIDNTIVGTGSERWFYLYPTTATTRITLMPEAGSAAALVAIPFAGDGTYLGGTTAPMAAAGDELSFVLNTEPYTYYYIGVLDRGDPDATNRSFYAFAEPASIPDTPITADGNYSTFSVDQGETRWFYFDIPLLNQAYSIAWKDVLDTDGAETADVYVWVYEGNYGEDRSYLNSIGGMDDGFTTHQIVPMSAVAYRRIWIEVSGTTGGDFSLMATTEDPPAIANLAITYDYIQDLVCITGAVMDSDGYGDLSQVMIERSSNGYTWTLYNGDWTQETDYAGTWILYVSVSDMVAGDSTSFIVRAWDRSGAASGPMSVEFGKSKTVVGIE
jgi:hypothetical protein